MPRNAQGKSVTTLPSLPEVHSSVAIPEAGSAWRKMVGFAGPAMLVCVGYMDPGNWATDIEGGARFGYQLIWVLLLSNMMAVVLQTLAARLGLVTGRDLAQACRDFYSRRVALTLWVLCEVAIMACDLAEVLGSAIAMNLLFGIPLIVGVLITAFDVLLLLVLQNFGIRKVEAVILSLVGTIGFCYVVEIAVAHPDWGGIGRALIRPTLSGESLYVAIGIIGATVMPHNLYLHSALVQTRRVIRSAGGIRQAIRYNLLDTIISLNLAFFVNAAILVMSAAVFFRNGRVVTELGQAYETLTPLLQTTVGHTLATAMASTLFGVALLCSGQSSTITGTMAGQIVMEGFVQLRLPPWLRRLITRLLAILPAVAFIAWKGNTGSYQLLILSQVVLSLQLPFAIVPLIQFTSNRKLMGEFVSGPGLRLLAWICAIIIISLNLWLLGRTALGLVRGGAE